MQKRNNLKRNLENCLGLAIWKSCTILDPYLAGQFLWHHVGYKYSTFLWLDNWQFRTDIGSGRVYCDPKPDPIEIGFGCLKPNPTWKIESVIRSVFSVSGRTFFFFFSYWLFSMSLYTKCYYILFCNNNLSLERKKKNPTIE